MEKIITKISKIIGTLKWGMGVVVPPKAYVPATRRIPQYPPRNYR